MTELEFLRSRVTHLEIEVAQKQQAISILKHRNTLAEGLRLQAEDRERALMSRVVELLDEVDQLTGGSIAV